jgi:hypothetical protein
MLFLLLTSGLYYAAATLEIFTQRFSADPAPLVVGDRVYMYTSHDIDNQTGWFMKVPCSSLCYASSKDPLFRFVTATGLQLLFFGRSR